MISCHYKASIFGDGRDLCKEPAMVFVEKHFPSDRKFYFRSCSIHVNDLEDDCFPDKLPDWQRPFNSKWITQEEFEIIHIMVL
jgi:hypothetical protein